ncbi:hypothetical protein BOTBODRAFT_26184 [Botryobasidium botryosum FD-172 SS1]|uniref:C2H2-type domain-containing protein n=1 Tax=Botryobasidium botryosum (strain FD-172 SS1) TaxID=930990 RepID=A0A067N181_BOTB1|nr:hypothetical protein BOTBODRAFT_26184 [Botryobasidium botryosum FD-172 SS1]
MLLLTQIHQLCSSLPQALPLSFAPVHNSISAPRQYCGHQQRDVLEANEANGLACMLLENAAREMQCVWLGCGFRASSWARLNKHVAQGHCATPAAVSRNTVRGGLASRPFVCRFPKCSHHAYSEADYLADHVARAHLNPLKLTCPVPHCTSRVPFGAVQLLVNHLARSHSQTPDSLPKHELRPLSPSASLPLLPDVIPPWQALSRVRVVGSSRFSVSPEYVSRHPIPIPDPFFGEHKPRWCSSDVAFSTRDDLPKETAGIRVDSRRILEGRGLDGDIPRMAAYKSGSIRESTGLARSKKHFRPSSIGILALVDKMEYLPTKQLAVKWRILDPSCDSAWSDSSVSDDDDDGDDGDDTPKAAKRRKL